MKDLKDIVMIWAMPEVQSVYEIKPQGFLSHLLGHEGRGSILSVLKARGWANELCAGEGQDTSDFSFFHVKIEATEEGMKHVEDIVRIVYAYIGK